MKKTKGAAKAVWAAPGKPTNEAQAADASSCETLLPELWFIIFFSVSHFVGDAEWRFTEGGKGNLGDLFPPIFAVQLHGKAQV